MTNTRKYYRSISDRQIDAEFRTLLQREFPDVDADKLDPLSRRRFLQLLGASATLAAAAGCRWEDEKILTFNERPQNRIPGVPQHFATAMEVAGVATPLLMTCYDGRPVKAEGNPDHPDSNGASGSFAQSSVLTLYDPDRSTHVIGQTGGMATPSDFARFLDQNREELQRLRRTRGTGLGILCESSSSPTLADMKSRLLRAMPQAKWHEWEAISDDETREGSRLAFGKPYRSLVSLQNADVVLCLDDDLLGSHPAALRHIRAFASRRDPDAGAMNRLYAVESNFSVTGSNADHRLPLRSGLVGAFLVALLSELGVEGAMGASTITANERIGSFIAAVAKDLKNHRGRSVVTCGPNQPAPVHAQVHRLNQWLGNAGKTVGYVPDPRGDQPRHAASLASLVEDMEQGRIDTLLILGGNPVYTAPADVDFTAALGKVGNSIHLSLYRDETSRRCRWHLPQAHFLESWGDARAWDGSLLVQQPMIAPLHGGKSAIEVLAMITLDELTDGYDLVRRTFDEQVAPDDETWRKSVHDGLLLGSAPKLETPAVQAALPPMPAAGLATEAVENGKFELNFIPDSRLFDGRFANNGWLQELPDYMTKLTWDNVALMNAADADELGVKTGQIVQLSSHGRELRIAAYVMPGHARGAVTVALGYGRTAAGVVGGSEEHEVDAAGFDTYRLRGSNGLGFIGGLRIEPTRRKYELAMVQDHHMIDTVGMEGRQERLELLVREADVAEYRENPGFVHDLDHGPELKSLWAAHPYDGQRWGMAIDLTKCTGCSACVIACQAENNIPIVGKERVLQGREMHWIRIDRYFSGDVDDPSVVNQPVPCQQCENAPCEQVCPVGATMHSSEGLNDMVYNRCVGTRYCSNNCPYKVRRFNFFNYHLDLNEAENQVLKMVYNPEVTIRARGVMEKCTYCVQRIAAARVTAKNQKRGIRDGEITPACAQSCPASAITFGDLNVKDSVVKRDHDNPRAYAMLAMLNVKPRTAYLARIDNPNPDLATPSVAKAH